MGPIEKSIAEKVSSEFQPDHMALENESHQHSVPRNSETHFKLLVVSSKFEGLARVARQRLVYGLLKDEMAPGKVHALSLRLLAPNEWAEDAANTFKSPNCMGGSKREGI